MVLSSLLSAINVDYAGEVFGTDFYICESYITFCWDRCGRIGGGEFCSCDEACLFYNDCCIDYEEKCVKNSTEKLSLTANKIEHILTDRMDRQLEETAVSCQKLPVLNRTGDLEESHFLMVAHCPKDTRPELASKCEESFDDLYSRTPVTDEYRLFKNGDCAICNNVSNFETLEMKFFTYNQSIVKVADQLLWLEDFEGLRRFVMKYMEYYFDISSVTSVPFHGHLDCNPLNAPAADEQSKVP